MSQPISSIMSLESTVEGWLIGPARLDELTGHMPSEQRAGVSDPYLVRAVASTPMQRVVGMLGAAVPQATPKCLMEPSRSGSAATPSVVLL